MAAASWARFLVGLGLAIESLRLAISGGSPLLAVILAIIYIILVAAYAIFRV